MGNEWKEYRLEDCMEAIIDYRGKTPQKASSGIPLVTAKIVKNGTILPYTEYIAEEDYDIWMQRGLPEPGDVVMTTEAPLGEVAQLDKTKVALAQRIITLRGKTDLLDNTFLRYLLCSRQVQYRLNARSSGTTVRGIKQSELRKIRLQFPSLPEQRRIAHILGTLDDKIALNRQQNATLEAMAQALFRSWFVDFDPVLDKALAAGHDIPEPLQAKAQRRLALGDQRKPLPPEVAGLFPDRFVYEEEVGWVPEGWEAGKLKDIGLNKRVSVKPDEIDPSTAYIGLQSMPQKSLSLMDWETSEEIGSNKYQFEKGDILFGKLRPYFHKVGIAPLNGVCSTDILVVKPQDERWFSLLLGHLNSESFITFTTNSSSGTRMPRTNWKDMGGYNIALPPIQVAGYLTELFKVSIDHLMKNIHESRSLAKLRDTLLPKLISGELRVPAAESLVEKGL